VIALDTSAIVAIAFDEAEADQFEEMIAAEKCLIGWPTVFEAHQVLSRIPRGGGLAVLQKVLDAPRIDVVAFDARICGHAIAAFDRYGRGHHRARLNYGDCMAYAVAKAHGVPLLYKGTDFGRTDVAAALP
jgi:ribonuclease VapC